MKPSPISFLLICAALLMVASGTLAAQDDQGIIRINGGRMTVALHPNSRKIVQATEGSPSIGTIYSDLGTGTNVYLPGIGWSVTGPDIAGGQVESATPFTPQRNFNLVLITVAMLTASGPNGVTLSLNQDSAGKPGAAIMTWNLVNLPAFPGCCVLDLAPLKQTVLVEKGVQYWVVASTSETTQDTSDSWNMNSLSIFGTVGQRFGSGEWEVTQNSALLPAFSVSGAPAD
jgi:hypothetical protein